MNIENIKIQVLGRNYFVIGLECVKDGSRYYYEEKHHGGAYTRELFKSGVRVNKCYSETSVYHSQLVEEINHSTIIVHQALGKIL